MDRTYRGLTAGLIGGVAMNLWNLSDFYLLHITRIRFLDWAAVLLTWERTHAPWETVVALLVHLIWDAAMGAVFAHLVSVITSRGLVLKSVLFSILSWFIFKGIVNLGRVPILSDGQTFPGRMSNLFAAIIWGMVTGAVLVRLERTAKVPEGH